MKIKKHLSLLLCLVIFLSTMSTIQTHVLAQSTHVTSTWANVQNVINNAQNGDVVKLPSVADAENAWIKIPDGLSITLEGSAQYVNLNFSAVQNTTITINNLKFTSRQYNVNSGVDVSIPLSAFHFYGKSNTLILKGENEILHANIGYNGTTCAERGSAVGVGEGADITIEGNGKLTAMGYEGAGIGRGAGVSGSSLNSKQSSHKITINSGTIIAGTYAGNGSGIGAGPDMSAGTIIINGGIITASGNATGQNVGIGGAFRGRGADITINGGTINATGTMYNPGIGTPNWSYGGSVTINGGTISAQGAFASPGIGQGPLSDENDLCIVTINGGTITSLGGENGAGLGGGYGGDTCSVTINGGTVTAQGGKNGAGIGTSYKGGGGKIVIYSGTVIAKGGENAAAIGGGFQGAGVDVEIFGTAKVTTETFSEDNYDIGPGSEAGADANLGSITVYKPAQFQNDIRTAVEVTIGNPDVILTGTTVDQTVNKQLVSNWGIAPYTYTAQGLLDGLSLSADGKLTGTPTLPGKNQSFTISATDSNSSPYTVVTTYYIDVFGISLDKTKLNLNKGDTATLKATIAPEVIKKANAVWESSDETIATVNNGTITAISKGIVTITASVGNIKAECIVSINDVVENNGKNEIVITVDDVKVPDKGAVEIKLPENIAQTVSSGDLVTIPIPSESIIAQIKDSSVNKVGVVINLPDSISGNADIVVSSDIFANAKEENKPVEFDIINDAGTLEYSWTFDNITNDDINVDLTINIYDYEHSPIEAEIKENSIVVEFKHEGELPANASVKLYAGNYGFKSGDSLYFYYFNPNNGKLEFLADKLIVDSELYIEISVNHCSSYVLSKIDLEGNIPNAGDTTPTPNTSDTTPIALLYVITLISGTAGLILARKRKAIIK